MEEALVKRVLPHSVEAEQSVIGSMLMDRDAIIAASEIVVADDFYQRQYGIMFDTMVELFNEGKPVDLVTLQDRLKERMSRRRCAVWILSAISWQRFRLPRMCAPMPRSSMKRRFSAD